MKNQYFKALVHNLSRCDEVEAILLAGSKASQTDDAGSDYDIYVYVNREVPVETRKGIMDKYCSYMELNNQYWETEDDGVLMDGTPIEFIYRSFDWLEGKLERVLFRHDVGIGYTTCLWSNLLNSKILYDPAGRASALQEKFRIPYPVELKRNIIRKNYPLLMQKMPAYYFQIKKALQRDDFISVNHRIAEFLASYFDILFAINEYPHPGEKRLLNAVKEHCSKLPEDFESDMTDLIRAIGAGEQNILEIIEHSVKQLDTLLKQEGLYPGC